MPAEATLDTATILAVDVGGTRARLALVRGSAIGHRSSHLTADLAGPGRDVTDRLVDAARALVDRAAEREPIAGPDGCPGAVGVSLGAAVDRVGSVIQPREFGIPGGTRLRDAFAAAFAVPVAVDNDANLAALAETRLGAARGGRCVAVITIGTNIGAGLVFDGLVHRGAHGAAGEAGLMLVPAPTMRAASGRSAMKDAGSLGMIPVGSIDGMATLEQLVGGAALTAAAHDLGVASRAALSPDIARDPRLEPVVDRAVEGWALVIANLAVVLDLDMVVLTGSVAQDAAHLLDRLRARVSELVPFTPDIRLGTLGPDAELLGADLVARAALDERARQDAGAGLSAQQ